MHTSVGHCAAFLTSCVGHFNHYKQGEAKKNEPFKSTGRAPITPNPHSHAGVKFLFSPKTEKKNLISGNKYDPMWFVLFIIADTSEWVGRYWRNACVCVCTFVCVLGVCMFWASTDCHGLGIELWVQPALLINQNTMSAFDTVQLKTAFTLIRA